MHDLFGKRALDQIIDTDLLKEMHFFLVGRKHPCRVLFQRFFRRYIKCKNDRLHPFFFLLKDIIHEQFMSTVQSVKFSNGQYRRLCHMKIKSAFYVLHTSVLFHKNFHRL